MSASSLPHRDPVLEFQPEETFQFVVRPPAWQASNRKSDLAWHPSTREVVPTATPIQTYRDEFLAEPPRPSYPSRVILVAKRHGLGLRQWLAPRMRRTAARIRASSVRMSASAIRMAFAAWSLTIVVAAGAMLVALGLAIVVSAAATLVGMSIARRLWTAARLVAPVLVKSCRSGTRLARVCRMELLGAGARFRRVLRASNLSIDPVPRTAWVLASFACGLAMGAFVALVVRAPERPRENLLTDGRDRSGLPTAEQNAARPILITQSAASPPSVSVPSPVSLVVRNEPQESRPVQVARAELLPTERRENPAAGVAPFRGSLAVSSAPAGAEVSMNGRPVGTTPLVLTDVPTGSRVVQVRLEGYQPWSFGVRVVADERTSVRANLVRASIR